MIESIYKLFGIKYVKVIDTSVILGTIWLTYKSTKGVIMSYSERDTLSKIKVYNSKQIFLLCQQKEIL